MNQLSKNYLFLCAALMVVFCALHSEDVEYRLVQVPDKKTAQQIFTTLENTEQEYSTAYIRTEIGDTLRHINNLDILLNQTQPYEELYAVAQEMVRVVLEPISETKEEYTEFITLAGQLRSLLRPIFREKDFDNKSSSYWSWFVTKTKSMFNSVYSFFFTRKQAVLPVEQLVYDNPAFEDADLSVEEELV